MQKITGIARPQGLKTKRISNFAKGTAFEVFDKDTVTEIELYDEIGFWGVSAGDFKNILKTVKSGTINLKINSPGGDVFDGIAIFNDLLDHPAKINVHITGYAASAASIVAMAGDTVTMAENAFFMIHRAWTIGIGNTFDMAKTADFLSKIDDSLIKTYTARTSLTVDAITDFMDAETWFNAEEAESNGFIDGVTSKETAKASFDLSVFANAPAMAKSKKPDTIDTKRDLERALRDAGYSCSAAKAFSSKAFDGELREAANTDALANDIQQLIKRYQR